MKRARWYNLQNQIAHAVLTFNYVPAQRAKWKILIWWRIWVTLPARLACKTILYPCTSPKNFIKHRSGDKSFLFNLTTPPNNLMEGEIGFEPIYIVFQTIVIPK